MIAPLDNDWPQNDTKKMSCCISFSRIDFLEIVLAKKWILASRAYRGNFLGQFGGQLLSTAKIIKHTASACIEWEQTKKKINSGNSEQIWKSGGRHDIKHLDYVKWK